MAEEIADMDAAEVRIMSRHEDLQHTMEREYPQFKYILGDVRDYRRVDEAMRDIDVVFHAAALKQVPDNEVHPMEAVKTNILGAYNVKQAAIKNGVDKVVFISTDKAVKPVNVMGMTKSLQERIFVAPEIETPTKFIGVRYGNVVGSRGSVIPYFFELAGKGEELPLTSDKMTRFLLTLPNAIKLVFHALQTGKGNEIFVRKSPAANIKDLAEVILEVTKSKSKIKLVPIRPGEKIHETLVQEEEMRRTSEDKEYFTIHPYGKYENKNAGEKEYTSENTERLNKNEIKKLLQEEGWTS
jgi:FlaA1/EpsC-like NDP-sugar epimerase